MLLKWFLNFSFGIHTHLASHLALICTARLIHVDPNSCKARDDTLSGSNDDIMQSVLDNL